MWLGQYKVEFGYVIGAFRERWLTGITTTIWVTVAILAVSLIVGLIASLGRLSKNRLLYGLSTFYVEVMRNTPELVILFFFYFGIPQIGIRLNAYIIGILALALHTGGYVTEIFRSGIQSVSIEQYWSATALALSKRQTMWKVIIPQIKGDVLPALTNQFIYTLKDTPMLAFIFIKELMYQAYDIQTDTAKVLEVYVFVGIVYLALSLLLGWISRWLERYFKRYRSVA